MPSLPPIVVFDLDGTLAETAGDLVGTLNVILQRDEVVTSIGPPNGSPLTVTWAESTSYAAALAGAVSPTAERARTRTGAPHEVTGTLASVPSTVTPGMP